MPLESTIVAGIKRVATARGWWVQKIHGNAFQSSGLPDLLCIRQGRAAWMEVKQPGRRATPLQVARMREIEQQAGAPCAVVTSKEEAAAFLSRFEGQPS